MKLIYADAETFYSREYSLRAMTPAEYILDPRFETIGWSVAENNDAPFWLHGDDFERYLSEQNLDDCAIVSFNALFDMCIVSYRYGFVPKLMIDVLGMARAMLAHKLKRLALENVSRYLGVGEKGRTVHNVMGMTRQMIIDAGLYDEYVEYGKNDSALCRAIFKKLIAMGFPTPELAIKDMVLRCAVMPKFKADQTLLHEHLNETVSKKEQLLNSMAMLGIGTKEDLMSNDKFAEVLKRLGVDPPTKISARTGQSAWAFSKSDAAFLELQEHDDPAVQMVMAARLGNKTTLEETRTKRFISISNLQWPENGVGVGEERWMPVPLRYSGAHTHRLSGEWKINMQNLTRGGKMRRALIAPPGHTVLTADASQIEARIVAVLANQQDLIDQFERGDDVYSLFAGDVFQKPINKKEHPVERFCGKQAVLGLGYNMGWNKFQRKVYIDAKNQMNIELRLSDEQSQHVVNVYRTKNYKIKQTWRFLDQCLNTIAYGGAPIQFGPVLIEKGRVVGPNGLCLYYDNLRQEDDGSGGKQWVFDYAEEKRYIYGGKLLENITQFISRVITMEAAARVQKRIEIFDEQLAMQVHDELVYVVRDDILNVVKQILYEEMIRRPSYMPNLPLAAETGTGRNYGDAK